MRAGDRDIGEPSSNLYHFDVWEMAPSTDAAAAVDELTQVRGELERLRAELDRLQHPPPVLMTPAHAPSSSSPRSPSSRSPSGPSAAEAEAPSSPATSPSSPGPGPLARIGDALARSPVLAGLATPELAATLWDVARRRAKSLAAVLGALLELEEVARARAAVGPPFQLAELAGKAIAFVRMAREPDGGSPVPLRRPAEDPPDVGAVSIARAPADVRARLAWLIQGTAGPPRAGPAG